MKTLSYFFIFASVSLLGFSSCKKSDATVEDFTSIDNQIIRTYIKEHNLDADSTASGLYYVIDKPGVGKTPSALSYVKIRYKGYLTSGKIFDEAKQSVTFPLQNLILGWQEGIPKFKEGGQGILLVPSHLGYGDRATSSIPANSVLIFEIKLDEVL